MARKTLTTHLKYLIICAIISLASSLTLPYQSTSKPRHTKYSSSTPAPGSGSLVTPANAPVTTTSSGVEIYRVTDSKGATCILLKTDGLIEINFISNIGEEKGDTYLPGNAKVSGECSDSDEATMTITWNGYVLFWSFSKTPGGERWYISNLELSVSTDLPHYHNIRTHGKYFTLAHDKMLIPTPVGKSYNCEETVIDLFPKKGNPSPEGLSGTLFLRSFQLQPFMYKGSNFGPEFECNAAMSFRDETAPIAVGSTLAIAVLLTVTGYGVFRYFKIKKVQYNTME